MFDRNSLEGHLNHIFPYLNKIDLNDIDLNNNVIFLDCNIISITKWFITYGHFKDELFNLYNFTEKLKKIFNCENKVLVDFLKSKNNLSYETDNYDLLNNFLFEDNIINANSYKSILKMKKVFLIEHIISSEHFHLFPINAKNKILSKIKENNLNYKNIFITRGTALHLPRNINNQLQIEEFLTSKNYNLINPEIINIELFINSIKNAENVFITWGGALVNLVYLNKNTNVYILRSKSYQHESLKLFKFLFDKNNYNLNINIIDSDIENNVDISKLLNK
jgi:capsular polysaccharide biosynthesis protein